MGILEFLIEFFFVVFYLSFNCDYLITDVIEESVNGGLSLGRGIVRLFAVFGSNLVPLSHSQLSFEKLKLRKVDAVLIVGVEDVQCALNRLIWPEGGKVLSDNGLPHFLQLSEGPINSSLKLIQKSACVSLGAVEWHEFVEEVIGLPSSEVFLVALSEYFADDPFVFLLEAAEGHLLRELLPLRDYFLDVFLFDLNHARQKPTVWG